MAPSVANRVLSGYQSSFAGHDNLHSLVVVYGNTNNNFLVKNAETSLFCEGKTESRDDSFSSAQIVGTGAKGTSECEKERGSEERAHATKTQRETIAEG